MRTLILPDIHNKVQEAQRIIEYVQADRVVCLGDYFDDYGDGPADAARTANWLVRKWRDKNITFLVGNHDLPYLQRQVPKFVWGWTPAKHQAAALVRSPQLLQRRFKFWCYAQGWLCSHAGFALPYLRSRARLNGVHGELKAKLLDSQPMPQLITAIGRERGGLNSHGGVLWQDWSALKTWPGVPQIVGHSYGSMPRVKRESMLGTPAVCLDTGLRHYGVITDTVLSIYDRRGNKVQEDLTISRAHGTIER